MCGRFSLTTTEKQFILSRFELDEIKIKLEPRYNIAPSQMIPVIRNDYPHELNEAKWGLIPHWAKDETNAYKMINARSETISEKPAYREAFKRHRCLIIADSFYEWNKKGGLKTPYRIMLKNEDVFAFAGIFDIWHDTISCSIATTEPNKLMEKIHIRMPVILQKKDEKRWLESEPEEALKLLKPYDVNKMKMYEVSSQINSPANDFKGLIEPVNKSTLAEFMG